MSTKLKYVQLLVQIAQTLLLRRIKTALLEQFCISITSGRAPPKMIAHRLNPWLEISKLFELWFFSHTFSNILGKVPDVKLMNKTGVRSVHFFIDWNVPVCSDYLQWKFWLKDPLQGSSESFQFHSLWWFHLGKSNGYTLFPGKRSYIDN